MRTIIIKISLTIILSLLYCLGNYAQVKGQLYTAEEANRLYGPVLVAVSISSADLENIASKSNEVLMFKIYDNKLVILGDDRNVLNPIGASVSENDVFTVFSVSKITELLSKGQNNTTFVEQRKDVLTITNGGFTLEFGVICPPWC